MPPFKAPWTFSKTRSSTYTPLSLENTSVSDIDETEQKGLFVKGKQSRQHGRMKALAFLVLFITNAATLFVLVTGRGRYVEHGDGDEYAPGSWAHVDTLPTTYERFNWWTEYTDKNFTQTDELWDAIVSSHGFIAMDREWARARHWPESMHLPSDDSKNVYLLEAYHLLHCVTVIRKTFWQAVHREDKYTFNPPHAGHCIDMMRQYIMCKADNTPLYLFGDDTAGDEQYRQCNDWNTLKQFATDHSACYQDTPPDVDPDTYPLGAHFGHCDNGDDGLKRGARSGNWKHGFVFDGSA